MRVFTFFDPLPSIDPKRELALLEKWAQSWEKQGWEPVILGLGDAIAQNETLTEDILHSEELARGPLPAGYAASCHLRWIAHQAHGGLHVDYDVINRSFTPWRMEVIARDHGEKPILLFGSPCPCAVWATPENCEVMHTLIIRQMLDPDRSTGELASVCHDQAVFAKTPHVFKMLAPAACQNYGTPGWEQAPLVHFANAVASNPRHELVARVMP